MTAMPIIPTQITDADTALPSYTRHGDAAVDVRASRAAFIAPGETVVVPTGLRVAVPAGFVMLVCSRSGLAANHGVIVANAPGVVDPNYRGEVKVALLNTSKEPFLLTPGDRIAQLLVVAAPKITFEKVEDIDAVGTTERGSDGFGSSGIA